MKSSTFMDSLVIYFLNRGVLMRTFIAFSWYYIPRCIASITEGEPRMVPNATPTNMQAFCLMKIRHSTFSSLINVRDRSFITSQGGAVVLEGGGGGVQF